MRDLKSFFSFRLPLKKRSLSAILIGAVWFLASSSLMPAAEPVPPVLDEFIQQMSSEDKVVKREASYRISQMGPEAQKAVPVLIKALEERDDQIWFNAITALARIGPAAKEAVPALIRELEQADRGRYRTRSQYRAAFALGSIGPDALPALQKALSHDQAHVREGAAKALTWIGSPAKALIPDLIKNLHDENDDVRNTAAEALGAIGWDSFHPVMEVVRGKDSETTSKVAAGRALGWLSRPPAAKVEALLETFESQSDPAVRAALIRTLDKWRCEPDRFLPHLVAALQSEDEALREAGVDALILLERPAETSVPALVKCLNADSQVLREQAAQVLGAIGPDARAAVPVLEKRMQDQSLPEQTRRVFREALAAIKP